MAKQKKTPAKDRASIAHKAGKGKKYLSYGDPARTHDGPKAGTRRRAIRESMASWRQKHNKAIDGTEDSRPVADTRNRDNQPETMPGRKVVQPL